MKLIKVEFENLNSLYGRHSIDFEKDLFNAPIFLIVGSTGAGKSTIMDAISLSLFGQTPRLIKSKTDKDLENDSRQIMSNGTTSAFAQLTFSKIESGLIKKYRATWQCERAFKKPDGNFKDPRRILESFCFKTNEWLQIVSDFRSKFYEPCFNKVLENLNVEDFKRMVLLAQGEFAAFLKANEDERAAILERLTNTEKYKDIGKKASEKKKYIDNKLQELKTKLHDVTLLTKEEEMSLQAEKVNLDNNISKLEIDLQEFSKVIEWYELEKILLEKLREAENNFNKYKEKYNENIDFINKLNLFYVYKNSINLILKENILKKEQENLHSDVLKYESEIQLVKEKIKNIILEINTYTKNIDIEKYYFLEKKDEIEKSKKLRFIKETIVEDIMVKEKKIISLNDNQLKYLSSIKVLSKKIEEIENYKDSFRNEIISELKLILLNFSLFDHSFNELKLEFNSLKEVLKKLSLPFDHPNEKLNFLNIEKENILEKKELFFKSSFYIDDIQKKKKEIVLFENNIVLLNNKIQNLNENITDKKNDFENNLKEISILKESINKVSWRIDFIKNRKILENGEKCPLCGNENHSNYHDKLLQLDDEKTIEEYNLLINKLNNKEEDNNIVFNDLNLLEKKLNLYNQEKFSIECQIISTQKSIEERKIYNKEIINKVFENIDFEYQDFFNIYNKENNSNENKLILINDSIKLLSENFIKYNTMKDDFINKKEINNLYLKNIDNLNNLLIYIDSEFNLDLFKMEISVKIKNHNSDVFILKDKKYFEKYREIEKDILLCNRENLELEKELIIIENNIYELKNEINKLSLNKQKIDEDILLLLNGEDPYLFEKNLNSSILKKQNDLNNEKNLLSEEERNLVALDIVYNRLLQDIKKTNDNIASISSSFLNEISFLEFKSKEEILRFNLDEKTINELELLNLELEKMKISTSENKLQRENDLRVHRNIIFPDKNKLAYDDVISSKNKIKENLEYKNDLKSKLLAKIIANDENKNKSLKLYEELRKLQEESVVWQRLHQIIGVNNGEQFKKFAQILNLKELSEKANVHLSRFEKRYSLVPALDAEKKARLAFAIKDSYYANELRSFKTLSGGETFLVSLALALALADYRAVNMPIETILLDEGFGTLDSATLQIAMGALETLNSNGTQVGIISHVDTLKEAITTRIVVEKKGNGHSVIRIET